MHTASLNRPSLLSADSGIHHDNESGVLFFVQMEILMEAYEKVKEQIKKEGNTTVIKQLKKTVTKYCRLSECRSAQIQNCCAAETFEIPIITENNHHTHPPQCLTSHEPHQEVEVDHSELTLSRQRT